MFNLILSNTISFIILTYIGSSILESRNNFIIISILTFIVLTTICTNISISSLSTIILTLSYLLFLIISFKGTTKRFALILLYFISASAVAEIIAANFINLIFTLGPNDIHTFKYTLAVIISGIISLIMSKLFINIFKSYDLNILPKYTYLILLLPISTMILILDIHMYFEIIKYDTIYIFALFGLIVSNYITISVFFKFANAAKAENELLNIKKENELSNAKYELLNNQFNANYKFLHDTVRSLMKLINSNLNSFEIKEQLYNLNNKLVKGLNIINSNSMVVSPILNHKLTEILEYKIDFKTVMEYNDFTFINSYIQREIFSILLNIAIEQCRSIENNHRFVILKTKKIGNQIIIQLLISHHEFTEYTKKMYTELDKKIASLNGSLSYQSNFLNNNSDSLIIVFNELIKKM